MNNPGAAELAAEVVACLSACGCTISATQQRPELRRAITGGGTGGSLPQSSSDGQPSGGKSHNPRAVQQTRCLLLYLNTDTWVGSAGQQLATEVRQARAAGEAASPPTRSLAMGSEAASTRIRRLRASTPWGPAAPQLAFL